MKSFIDCFRRTVAPRYRARLEHFLDEGARAAEGSCCAKQAFLLLALIERDGREAAQRERRREETGGPYIIRRDIFAVDFRCGLTDAGYRETLELLDSGGGGLLMKRHSNALALATIAEAMVLAQRSTLPSDLARMERTLLVLEALDAMLRADYAPLSTLGAREAAEAGHALLKHRGKGIMLLMAQHRPLATRES